MSENKNNSLEKDIATLAKIGVKFDGTRFILPDGIHTLAWGHYRLKEMIKDYEDKNKMEEEKIKRYLPPLKYPITYYPQKYIPFKLRKEDFLCFGWQLKEVSNLKEKYEKLKRGINYNTDKKIQYGKETYIKLLQELKNYVLLLNTKEKYRNTLTKEDLETIEKINEEVVIINNLISDYNEKRSELCKKMQELSNWREYTIFENKKYGLFKECYNNLHHENDCLGRFERKLKKKPII